MTTPTLTLLFAAALAATPAEATRAPLVAPKPPPAPAPATPERLDVYPPAVNLSHARDRQGLIAVLSLSDGTTRDVTAEATLTAADDAVAKAAVGEDGLVFHPLKDGETTLTVSHAGFEVTVPVVVKDAAVAPPVTFRNDVMPIFARTGCNMGSCHGAARGKDGFRLSLFGFDPAGDHFRLTREFSGRRLNMGTPDRSLLIEKSVGAVSHTGGKRFEPDSEYAARVVEWIAAGAHDDDKVPDCVALELYPPRVVLTGEGSTQRLTARAIYEDGTDRDVTHLVAFASSNPVNAPLSEAGVVTAGPTSGTGGAEAFLTARFDVHTVGVPAVVLPERARFEWPEEVEPRNYVDELVHDKLRTLRIAPSAVCTDAEFVRRVYLDLNGAVPPPEAARTFVADGDPDKRAALVDELLSRPAFADIWVMKWAELLQIRETNVGGNSVSGKNVVLYHAWLRDKIDRNVPVDEMVRELLGSSGGTFEVPATNYYQVETDTLKTSENVAQVFMGMRIQCAQCHNHPFDRWTMDDYYGFASFFSQVGRKRAADPRERIVYNRNGGEVPHPVTNKPVPPRFLGGASPDFKNDPEYRGRDRREVVAEWLTSEENPYFARNFVNIVWAHHTGRGIVEPVDDVRVSNPPANAELLSALADRFVKSGYDLKALVKDICASRTYQLATRTNRTNFADEANFAHAKLRRIRAEVLLDSLNAVTDSPEKFQGLPLGSRAVEIPDGNTSTYFLDTFGRAKRETVCSCEVRVDPNLSQALHLLNGDAVTGKIGKGKLVESLLKEGREPAEVLGEITARALSREPTDRERAALQEALAAGDDPRAVLEDYFWAVLNSREFLFNH